MKRILTIVLPVVMLPVLASEVYESEIGSILQAVSSTNRMTRLNATNRIDALMMSLSNREEIATCKLLIAELLQTGNMRISFRTIAASSLLLSDSAADVSVYTNGLPTSALSVINAIRLE